MSSIRHVGYIRYIGCIRYVGSIKYVKCIRHNVSMGHNTRSQHIIWPFHAHKRCKRFTRCSPQTLGKKIAQRKPYHQGKRRILGLPNARTKQKRKIHSTWLTVPCSPLPSITSPLLMRKRRNTLRSIGINSLFNKDIGRAHLLKFINVKAGNKRRLKVNVIIMFIGRTQELRLSVLIPQTSWYMILMKCRVPHIVV
ncbi:Uncharacterised protein [Chlamydia trachomatis]|nr:Uncharacterised protein [Chlamydia trachomatis]